MGSSTSGAAAIPRALPPIGTGSMDAETAGLYMRPHLGADGTIPSSIPFYTCPDIWPAGTTPIPDYQTVLAGDDPTYGYGQSSGTGVELHMDNYVYVRARNGAGSSATSFVKLYYSPSGIIQHPAKWRYNVLKTDEGSDQVDLTNVGPGEVAVGNRPFVWSGVPKPPNGNHYCLFSQINDNQDSNPFPPDDLGPSGLGGLLRNNLQFGWRNVQWIDRNNPTVSDAQPFDIPLAWDSGNVYSLQVELTDYEGWYVAFECSQVDVNNQPIKLPKTRANSNKVYLGVQNIVLDAGFNSLVTIYLYNDDGVNPGPNARAKLVSHYVPDNDEQLRDAIARDAVDWKASHDRCVWTNDVEPTPVVPIGEYNYHAK